MNQITTQLDRIIARLKQNEKLAKVKFIREHGNHGAEINLTSFLAVVAVTDTVLSKKYVGDYLSASVKGEQFFGKKCRSLFMLLPMKTATDFLK